MNQPPPLGITARGRTSPTSRLDAVRLALALALALLAAGASAPRAGTIHVSGARVLPASGPAIEDAGIVVKDGVITAVAAGLPRPPFSRQVDAAGMTITPGFVVALSRLGIPAPPAPPPGDGLRIEVKADVKAADELLWRDDSLRALAAHGVTLAGLLPPSREAGIPGLAVAVSTAAETRSDAIVSEETALVILPLTPEPWRKAMRDAFRGADAARRVRDLRQRRGAESPGKPGILERVMRRQVPVLLLAPTPALLAASADAIPLDRMDASVLDGTDLWWEAPRVKELGLRVLTPPVLIRRRGTRFPVCRAAEWIEQGVKVAFLLPDDSPAGAALLRDAACDMVRAGVPPDIALRALTLEPAAALGLSAKAGSIQPGRRADLLFWSGDPFDPSTRLLRVMSAGRFLERPESASGAP